MRRAATFRLYPTPSVGAHSGARRGVPCRDFDHDARVRSRVSDMAVHGFAAARASAIVATPLARARVPNASGRPVVQRPRTRPASERVASTGRPPARSRRARCSRVVSSRSPRRTLTTAPVTPKVRARVTRRRHPTRPERRRCPSSSPPPQLSAMTKTNSPADLTSAKRARMRRRRARAPRCPRRATDP